VCIAFKRVVVDTCDWAELRFRGKPGPEEVVEYIDIRLLLAMARLSALLTFRSHHAQNFPTSICSHKIGHQKGGVDWREGSKLVPFETDK
jgi:hypothetical protein